MYIDRYSLYLVFLFFVFEDRGSLCNRLGCPALDRDLWVC